MDDTLYHPMIYNISILLLIIKKMQLLIVNLNSDFRTNNYIFIIINIIISNLLFLSELKPN